MQQISKFLRGTKSKAEKSGNFVEISGFLLNIAEIGDKFPKKNDERLSVEDIVSISTDNGNFGNISIEISKFFVPWLYKVI